MITVKEYSALDRRYHDNMHSYMGRQGEDPQWELHMERETLDALLVSTDQDAKNLAALGFLISEGYMIICEFDLPHR